MLHYGNFLLEVKGKIYRPSRTEIDNQDENKISFTYDVKKQENQFNSREGFSDAEAEELKELMKWASENLAREYWDGSEHISGGELSGSFPGTNITAVIGCKSCEKTIVKHQEITST